MTPPLWDVAEVIRKIFNNFSIFEGRASTETETFKVSYMVKIVTPMEPSELIGVLSMIQEQYKISIGFEANGKLYSVS